MKIPIKETIKLTPEVKGGYLNEPLLPGEKPFSSFHFQTEVAQEDIQMVRNWKNDLVKIRDKYKGTNKCVIFELELKHAVDFLNKLSE